MSRISEIRSSGYGEVVNIVDEIETRYFARRKELIDLGGDWTKEDLQEMLFEIFERVGYTEYVVGETISGGIE